MNYMEQDYQKKQIEANQKFLLKLLHLRIGNYYPLRKWLGIDYKGKIDEISHLSYGYNTEYFKKGNQWYKKQTRVYQQPDLGYKLNLVLDKIPRLSFAIPALLQPAYGLGALAFFFLTQTTYQPATKDTYLNQDLPNNNYGSSVDLYIRNQTNFFYNALLDFNLTDIPNGAIFSQGDLSLYYYNRDNLTTATIWMYRVTQLGWTEGGATWNTYDGSNAWATAGGDYTTTNGVSTSVADPYGWKVWSSPTLIQDCWDNQSKHINLLGYMSNLAYLKYFRSSNYTTDTSLRPKLTVTYTVPVKDNSIFFSCNF